MIGAIFAVLLAAAPTYRTVDVAVTSKGFEPARIEVKKGETVRLVVTRKTDRTCATEVVLEGNSTHTRLPLNQPVTIDFTPSKTGQVRYACGMGMVGGVLVVGD